MLNTEDKEDAVVRLLQSQSDILHQIVRNPDSLQMLEEILEMLLDQPGLDAVWVLFVDDADRKNHLLVSRGLGETLKASLEEDDRLQACLMGATEREPDWDLCLREHKAAFLAAGLKEIIAQPIRNDKGLVGALVGASRTEGPFNPAVQMFLEQVAVGLGGRVSRQRTESTLRNTRHNLDNLLETLDDFIFIVDGDGAIVFTNAGNLRGLGLHQMDLPGRPIDELLPGVADLMGEVDHIATVSEGMHCFLNQRLDLVGADGRHTPVEVRAYQGRWDDSNVNYLICRDISVQLGTELERDRLVKAVNQTRDSVIITDAEGTITYTNPAFTRLTGYSTQEVVGRNPRLLNSGTQKVEYYKQMWETISRGRDWTGRMVNRRKNGDLFTEVVSISPLREDGEEITHFVAVKRDITHEVALEERLRQSQKLETIGTLTGGLAHDFNNILYALLGYAELAKDDLEPGNPAILPLDEVIRAGDRMSRLVNRMLTLGRRKSDAVEEVRIKSLVELNLDLVKAALPGNIVVETDFQSGVGSVLADPDCIHHVLLNLCTNSSEAMQPDGGTLTLSVDRYEHAVSESGPWRNLSAGAWVRLSVTDTGRGMDPSVLERIFDPYFTTRNAEDGSGLGLATVQGIMESLGGRIFASSRRGEGATITCFFPPADQPQGEPARKPEVAASKDLGPGAGRQVLVVDDEEMIIGVMKRALARSGFQVTGLTDSLAALDLFRSDPHRFDLLITDQTMPGLSGIELATNVSSLRSELPIILMTGYSGFLEEDSARERGITGFLPKPLRIGQLVEEVLTLLDAAEK